jgi:hypothetical protein
MWERPASSLETCHRVAKRSEPGLILLAEQVETREIAAVCSCVLTERDGWIGGLAVLPAHRRKGLG